MITLPESTSGLRNTLVRIVMADVPWNVIAAAAELIGREARLNHEFIGAKGTRPADVLERVLVMTDEACEVVDRGWAAFEQEKSTSGMLLECLLRANRNFEDAGRRLDGPDDASD